MLWKSSMFNITFHPLKMRLNRALEDAARAKSATTGVDSKKDDLLVQARQEIQSLQQDVRRSEKQKTEIVAALKKQMQLIDVLKRQKLHLEAARVLAFSEDEFMRCLDWKV
jgi:hypothetical protein